MSFEKLRREVFDANLDLVENGLVVLTWGNASGIDREKGVIAIKPSGVSYAEMKPEDLVLLDLDGNIVEGTMRPSSDTPTHLVLYRAWPEIGGVVHTHSLHATAFAQAGKPIPCFGTTKHPKLKFLSQFSLLSHGRKANPTTKYPTIKFLSNFSLLSHGRKAHPITKYPNLLFLSKFYLLLHGRKAHPTTKFPNLQFLSKFSLQSHGLKAHPTIKYPNIQFLSNISLLSHGRKAHPTTK